jgi:ribosomal protein L9
MYKGLPFYAILICIFVLPSMAIEFDVNSASYKRANDFWTVDIPVRNISLAYSISYENLPTGWKTQANSLLIPASVTKYEANYPLKVSVKSSAGIVLRRTLLFKLSGSGLFVGDYPYDYNFQSTTSASSSVESTGNYVKNSEPLSTNITSTRTLRTEYNDLPSLTDLDKIIDTADIVLITKTIQSVISSNLNCLAKLGYLSDFLGKIESYVSIKGFRARDLNEIIENAKAEIIRLQGKVNDSQREIDGLGIPSLKTQLDRSLSSLDLAYADFNKANIDTSPFELKLKNFNNEITDLNTEISKANSLLSSDRTEIVKLDSFIIELQDKLAKAIQERTNYQKRVDESQNFLTKSLARVQEVQRQISEIDLQIKNILALKEKLKTNSNNLERQVDQIKQKIALSIQREGELISKITDLKIQINAQQLKLDRKELDNIGDMIIRLEREVLIVRQKIDQLDLQCNGVIDVKIEVLDTNDIVYTFNPNNFESYFNGFYGINAYSNFVAQYQGVRPSTLYGYNMFSDQWANLYGRPFQSDLQLAYANGLITNYSFLTDFQCSNYQSLINLDGKIQSIAGNVITVVDSNGKTYDLQLGACSRINGVNQYYPTIGNLIEWRGVNNYDNKYYVHTATCF